MAIPTTTPHLTDIPWRSSARIKAHVSLGRAKAAVAAQRVHTPGKGYGCAEAKVYEWRDGAWQLLYDIERGTPHLDLPWKKAQA